MGSSSCKHPQFIGATCLRCGKSKFRCPTIVTTPFHYLLPNLSLSVAEVERLRNKDLQSLLARKKLHLLLDLDNTLVHATHVDTLHYTDRYYISHDQKHRKPDGAEGYIHELVEDGYVFKVRPGTIAFLDALSSIFDMSVYTMGTRLYADIVANVIDPDKRFFKSVIAFEDCTTDGLKGLDVVLSHERMVVIVDDSKLVWRNHSANLVQIAPYTFFSSSKILNVQKLVKMESWTSMDMGLVSVLATLKSVHSKFYNGKTGYDKKDVREVLKSVVKNTSGGNCDDGSIITSRKCIKDNKLQHT